jgi:hypothetical protein
VRRELPRLRPSVIRIGFVSQDVHRGIQQGSWVGFFKTLPGTDHVGAGHGCFFFQRRLVATDSSGPRRVRLGSSRKAAIGKPDAGSWVCFFPSRVLPRIGRVGAGLGSCRKVTIGPRGEAGLGSFLQEHHEPQSPCYTMGLRLPASFLRRCLCS